MFCEFSPVNASARRSSCHILSCPGFVPIVASAQSVFATSCNLELLTCNLIECILWASCVSALSMALVISLMGILAAKGRLALKDLSKASYFPWHTKPSSPVQCAANEC